MSLLVENELTPTNAKLLNGCGDGVKNEFHYNQKRQNKNKGDVRTPVPSCRRFATRPPPTHRNDHHNTDVRVKLQNAIQELATHPNITRRRSLTMAEINPTRSVNKNKNIDGLHQLSAPVTRRVNVGASHKEEDDAGRRVYHLLLLNAWRQRRTQVATLSDSLATLETQNGRLELQIDVLRQLGRSECDKRTAAVAQNQRLHKEIEETLQKNDCLLDDKTSLEKEIIALEKQRDDLKLEAQNVRNDWMTVQCESKNFEQQLGAERVKIKLLRKEKQTLSHRLSEQEQHSLTLSKQMEKLQDTLLNTERNLQDTIMTHSDYEDKINALLERISSEASSKSQLQKQIQELTSSNEMLDAKFQDLKKGICNNKESTKKLEGNNQQLKKQLVDVMEALKQERARPWWKNAGELALAPLTALQMAAYVMLPAVPSSTISRSTSTTDILSIIN